jgi:hypothetical protein
MADFNTIHIFGFGDAQIIGKDANKTKKVSELTKAQALIDEIYSKKPSDNTSTKEYHAINIFNDLFVVYIPKNNNDTKHEPFRVEIKDITAKKLNDFVNELSA